ncbi:hypothetical protein BGZ80_001355 [Entomortierella chlamydospora]|uniref:C2H2-type domain-containing protein n=1 Tax=Entomortierella chlamydospora TaxID=101097 RepID=A0A9P6SY11_9FUNG|nr:hypothetical protein BGZ80_001355 [Entomortierella chlamydospora]
MEKKTSDPGPPPLRENKHINSSVPATSKLDLKEEANRSLDPSVNVNHVSQSGQIDKSAVASLPTSDTERALPYAWHLLPQEKLEEIAYNSRKQRKARLKVMIKFTGDLIIHLRTKIVLTVKHLHLVRKQENPPKCPNCPNVRLTSMTMLSSHLLSKKHLARAKKQAEQNQAQPTPCTSAALPSQQSFQTSSKDQATGSTLEERTVSSAQDEIIGDTAVANINSCVSHQGANGRVDGDKASSDMDVDPIADKTDLEISNDGNPTPQQNLGRGRELDETGKKSSKQRKRKAERDRKKARIRLEKSSISNAQVIPDKASSVTTEGLRTQESGLLDQGNDIIPPTDMSDLGVSSQNKGLPSGAKTKRRRPKKRRPGISVEPLNLDSSNLSDDTQLTTEAQAIMKPMSHERTSVGGVSHTRWHCSICGERWKREKAWHGHLLSAQHMRRALQMMRQITPPIMPYGRNDVQASKDSFGWGTGLGMVEEEDDDEEFEDEDSDSVTEKFNTNAMENIDNGGDNSNDDMDLED